eukprot:9493614-Pyramimonas_sp.AAC.2
MEVSGTVRARCMSSHREHRPCDKIHRPSYQNTPVATGLLYTPPGAQSAAVCARHCCGGAGHGGEQMRV